LRKKKGLVHKKYKILWSREIRVGMRGRGALGGGGEGRERERERERREKTREEDAAHLRYE
jgi:hypothetical protein